MCCFVWTLPDMEFVLSCIERNKNAKEKDKSAIFHNKPFCTFGQIVATLECLVRSSYLQLHGIVNLILDPTRRFGDCALMMARIPIDRFALSGTLVCY